ncbi:MAG: hypothetical protein AB9Q21_12690 [Candidatus Reddybacter sp.]
MIDYVPFLKLKTNEIMALKMLDDDILSSITPFFDYARRDNLTEESFVSTAEKLRQALDRHVDQLPALYIDNFDIDSDFEVDDSHNYLHLLTLLRDFNTIPVISIDRSDGHNESVATAKSSGINSSDIVAIRLTQEDFQDFSLIEGEIADELGEIIDQFRQVDLILDCRVCLNADPIELANYISNFTDAFCAVYDTRRVIVTGSSMPPTIGEVIQVRSSVELNRVELQVFNQVIARNTNGHPIVLGDYGSISPNYSDANIPKEAMQNVMTPKIIYAYEDKHFLIRGSAIKTHPLGNGQYMLLAQELLGKVFFRDEGYSFGEQYLAEKSRGEGNNATPGTMVKPLWNSHITYMCKDYV